VLASTDDERTSDRPDLPISRRVVLGWWSGRRRVRGSGSMRSVRLGLISDVHGNAIALDAVLSDGAALGVAGWWVLGDLAALGPEPTETLERLANLRNVRFVRGNTDRYVVTGERPWPHPADIEKDPSLRELFDAIEASFSWTRDELAADWCGFLATLPREQRLRLSDGTTLLGIHASPSSDDGPGITPEIDDEDLLPLLAGSDADVVCGGHTHQPTDRRLNRQRLVNLGSVSNPITSDLRATYVVIDDERDGHTLVHRRVAYDHEEVLDQLRRSSHPEAAYLASFQRGEQVRHPANRPGAPVFTN
jgi:predicted phosphodiesterase